MSEASVLGVGDDQPVVLAALRRSWRVLVAAVVLGAVAGYQLSSLQPVRYTAEARIVLSKVTPFDALGTYTNPDPERFLANQLNVLTSGPVLEAAVEELPGLTASELSDVVEATAGAEEDLLVVAATASTPDEAAARADAVALAYAAFRLRQVQAQTSGALSQAGTEERQAEIRTQASTYGNGLGLLQEAVPPTEPSEPRPARDAFVLAVVLGLAAVAYALLRTTRPQRLQRLVSAAGVAGVPVLAGPRPVVRRTRAEDGADALRLLLVTLDYVAPGPARRILLTGDAEGVATDTAVGLALAAAERGDRVVLVDGYGTGGRIATSAAVLPEEPGLPVPVTLVAPGDPLSLGGVEVVVLPASLDEPGGAAETAGRLAVELDRLAADLVLVDAPPVSSSPEGFALVGAAEVVVLVLAERSAPGAVQEAVDRLSLARRRLAGVVVASGAAQSHAVEVRAADHRPPGGPPPGERQDSRSTAARAAR